MYEAIPEELKQLKQWCCFRFEKRGEKVTKIPIDAHNGKSGKSNDESTWSDFKTALSGIEDFGLDGLGFYFKEPYFGIDIDKVWTEIERYRSGDTDDNIVSEFIGSMESYAEYSPSGTGIHILCKGKLPDGGRRKGNVEMYSSGRFFTVTGNAASKYTEVTDGTEAIKNLHKKYIQKEKTTIIYHPSFESIIQLNEDEVVQAALNSKNGKRFEVFLNGGWEAFYSSQSEADMAFANDLAFWTGRDYSKMDSIFRNSSLMRDKWDEKRKNTTYGMDTLNKAITECSNIYQPKRQEEDFQLHVLDDSSKKKEKKKYFSYDDTGNAERILHNFGDVIRYSYTNKCFYYYSNEGFWKKDQTGKIKRMADKVVEAMKHEEIYIPEGEDEEEIQKVFQKHLKGSRSNRGKTNMLKEVEHRIPITPDEFDKDKNLFNVQNGYLDLISGSLNEHDIKKYFSKISNVEYTDKIDCPRWIDFLDEIFNYDQDLIDFIQKAVGYSLTGSTREQCMFILFGNGRNGKSVFLDIINDLMGSYAINIQPQTIMVKQQTSGANSDIARLKGARLVTTTEPNEGVRLDEGLVKQLTGGDKVTARHLYGVEFEFEPEFKIWMATNHKPIIRGTDDGIWRRLKLIPFQVQIPDHKVDKNLKHKLRIEETAILNWAVEGALKWQKEGLKNPKAVDRASDDYRSEMDVTTAFVQECCVVSPKENSTAKELYQAYKEWAGENGQHVMNNTKFGREMGNKFNKSKSGGVIQYSGLSVRENYEYSPYKISY